MFITPEAGSVKDGEARTVALHPHLLEQGFPDAVRGKVGPLFYDPARYRGGAEGNPQYKKTGEHLAGWVRELGVDDPLVAPNHGWRHRFKSQAREVRMSDEIRDVIQGHVPRTEGETYGDVSPVVGLIGMFLLGLAVETPEGDMMRAAKDAVKGQLRDSGSAEFRNIEVYKTKDGHEVVCGEVNSKNGFGAMAGFNRFFYLGGNIAIMQQLDTGPEMGGLWSAEGCDGSSGAPVAFG